METGMLDSEEFQRGALQFAKAWQEHSKAEGAWCWLPPSNGLDAGYLAMEAVPRQATHAQQPSDACLAPEGGVSDEEDLAVEDEADDCAVLQNRAGAVHLFDYHICYHASYSVPVLLFRGRSQADGAVLSWEDILADQPAASRGLASAKGSGWAFIGQQEHPVLRRPWYALHPCETAALMRLLLTAADADISSTDISDADISSPHAAHRATDGRGGSTGSPSDGAVLQPSRSEGHTTDSSTAGKSGMTSDVGLRCVGEGRVGESVLDGSVGSEKGVGLSDAASRCDERGLRYLRAWLSLVAPAVGLQVPLDFWQQPTRPQALGA